MTNGLNIFNHLQLFQPLHKPEIVKDKNYIIHHKQATNLHLDPYEWIT